MGLIYMSNSSAFLSVFMCSSEVECSRISGRSRIICRLSDVFILLSKQRNANVDSYRKKSIIDSLVGKFCLLHETQVR